MTGLGPGLDARLETGLETGLGDAPGALYRGQVMHARLRPFVQRYRYRVWWLYLDLDRLSEAAALGGFALDRPGVIAFHQRDHGAADGSALRDWVDRALAAAACPRPARVGLLAHPRVAGIGFNPLSIYYAFGQTGRLDALIYEVRNTFGERHAYVCPVRPEEVSPAGIRQERQKLFFVSPFLDMALRYKFRLRAPGPRLHVRILDVGADGPVLSATVAAERVALSRAAMRAAALAVPVVGLSVLAAIHWQAARAVWKGAGLKPRPTAPAPISIDGRPVRLDRPAME